MRPPSSANGVQILLLLHVVAFGALGVFGVLRLFLAYLGNEVGKAALLSFVFGLVALVSAWAFYRLSVRNPARNRRAAAAIAALAWIDTALLFVALPLLLYRLRAVPWPAWTIPLPTGIFALLASTQALRRSAGHRVGAAGAAGAAAEQAP